MSPPDLLSPQYVRDPCPFYKSMRDEHPLFFDRGINAHVISRYEDVERGLKSPAFSSRNYEWQLEPVYGRTIIQMDGKEHSAKRAIISPSLRGSALHDKIVPLIEQNAIELIDMFRRRGEVDLVNEFTSRFPINVLASMLGLPREDHPRFRVWYRVLMAFFSNLARDPEVHEAGLRIKEDIAEYLRPIIARRRINPGEDLLSMLCAVETDGVRMTDDEIVSFCRLLIGAAGESVDRTMTNLFTRLVELPAQMQQLRADRGLVDRAFIETLRHSPPGNMLMRVTSEAVDVTGGTIPAGATVACVIGAANRDERRFERPESFEILREEIDIQRSFTAAAAHLTFGLGRHFCVGAMLAKAEMQVAVNLLLDAMPDARFADGVAPQEVGFIMRSPPTLRLRFTPAS
ncbi:MAG: cytochrome P450 [Byssovorax sp.]